MDFQHLFWVWGFFFLRKSFCCLAAQPVVFKSSRQQVVWTIKVHLGDKTEEKFGSVGSILNLVYVIRAAFELCVYVGLQRKRLWGFNLPWRD